MHKHRQRSRVGQQSVAVTGEEVFAHRDQRVGPSRGPGLGRGIGDILHDSGRRISRRRIDSWLSNGCGPPLGVRHAHGGLDRRLHQGALLGKEQGAEGEHAVVLEVRPHAAPAELGIGMLWCVEVENPPAGAADARELRAGRARSDSEPEILVLGGGYAAELTHTVEGQLPGRKRRADVGQRAERCTNAQQLVTGAGRETGADASPDSERCLRSAA